MYSAVIIGSGFSGLCLGIKLKEAGINDFVILEKANEVGGTWRENTYPGAECDIPSALYSYSFEPYPFWEYKWAHQPQILEYLKHCANKYGLDEHIHFNKTFTCAEWNDTDGNWAIRTEEDDIYVAKTMTLAIGQLHIPKTPDIKDKENFQGHMWHSSRWNHTINLRKKRVSVVGNAASAVQLIPEVAKIAKEVNVFQKSANWMLPKQDRLYRSWEKKLVSTFPILLRFYRFRIWILVGGLFHLMKKGNHLLRKFYQKKTINYINKSIADPELRKSLVPKYPLGARRILFSDNYYNALNKSNVQLITAEIGHFSEHSIHTIDGKSHETDVVVFATGFNTNPFFAHLDIKGKQGMSLKQEWKESPKSYFGMTVYGFPNMFVMYGPNTNLGHNSIIIMSEAQAKYITQSLTILRQGGWKSMEVKSDAVERNHEEIQRRLKKMIWAVVDDSWYKSKNGMIPNNWPGRTMEYKRRVKTVNKADFILVKA